MEKTKETSDLEKKLDGDLAILLRKSTGSRVTLCIDDVARGWNVDFICAEAVRSEMKSLRGDGSIRVGARIDQVLCFPLGLRVSGSGRRPACRDPSSG
jgi:hypothetical protein